jgi:hypothetical protein
MQAVADAPKIQIGFDPHAVACEEFLVLDERHQILEDPEWLRSFKRRLENKDLFVYRHKETGRFVLCHWLYKPSEVMRAVAQELEGWEEESWGWWPTDLMAPEVLLDRLRPVQESQDRKMKARRRADEAARSERDDRISFKRSHVRDLRRKGHSEMAAQVERGEAPVVPLSDERKKEWVEALRT